MAPAAPDPDDDPFAAPSRRPPSSGRRPRSAPVKPWDAAPDDAADEEWRPSGRRRFGGDQKPVYWRARDSLYFEPLVALAIVVLLLVGFYAFTTNWPPAYVVESDSMEHDRVYQLGEINAGDMILAEKVPNATIVPYVVGARTGVTTYGEYGDVVLYHPNGETKGTPIVHRSLLFLTYSSAHHWYNAPDLRGTACGANASATGTGLYYATGGSPDSCRTEALTISDNIWLYHLGWNSKDIEIVLSQSGYTDHSGYVTMGDGNPGPDQNGTSPLSSLVEPSWVIGVARGMLPWFGALKLLLEDNARNVSATAWEFLGLSVLIALFAAYGVHYALRTEGIESPTRRRLEEEEERAAETAADERDRGGEPPRFPGSIRPWKGDDEEPPAAEPARPAARSRPPAARPRAPANDAPPRHRSRSPRAARRPREADDDPEGDRDAAADRDPPEG